MPNDAELESSNGDDAMVAATSLWWRLARALLRAAEDEIERRDGAVPSERSAEMQHKTID